MIPRGVRFRVELPDGDGARLRVRELRRAVPAARSRAARLATASPIRATSSRRSPVRGSRRRVRARRQVHGQPVDGGDRPLAARRRRLARQLRAVQVRPAPLQRDRLDQLRPSGSVDLPGAAVAERHAGRRHDRLRDLPAAHPGDGAHVPAAVVPPQRRERVHGTDPRRLRRQGRRLHAGRREPAQLHDRARARRRARSRRRAPRTSSKPTRTSATRWRSCSRRARDLPDAVRARVGAAAGRVLPLLAGPARSTSIPTRR